MSVKIGRNPMANPYPPTDPPKVLTSSGIRPPMPNPLSAIKSAYDWATTPLVPEAPVRAMQERMTTPTLDQSPLGARLRGFGAGALEGLRSLTSPAQLASLAAMVPGVGGLGAVGKGAEAAAGLREAMLTPEQTAAVTTAAKDILNPGTARMMEMMHREASPTFKALEQAGTFAGDRTIGGLTRALAPRAETLGETTAEFTPQGGEGIYNIARPTGKQPIDPKDAAYLRVMGTMGRPATVSGGGGGY